MVNRSNWCGYDFKKGERGFETTNNKEKDGGVGERKGEKKKMEEFLNRD